MATTRRVVTGIDAQGKSYFLHDGPTPGHLDAGVFINDEIWVDDPGAPGAAETVAGPTYNLAPPKGGSTVRVFTFQPESGGPPLRLEDAMRFLPGDAMEPGNTGWHTTPTIDYGIVLSGEVFLQLDAGEVLVRAGDVVVQRRTRHAWRNRSNAPCVVAFVLVNSPNYA